MESELTESAELTIHEKRKLARKILKENPHMGTYLMHEDEIRAEKCRRDFFYFTQQFINELIPGDVNYNFHIPFLCNKLQEYAWRVIARLPALSDLIINIPPGTTKSTIISQLFAAWCWIAVLPETGEFKAVYEKQRKQGRLKPENEGDPEKRITGGYLRFCGVSFNEKTSTENARKHKQVVECDKYQKWFPELRLKKDAQALLNFWNTSGGQRWTVGIDGGIIGQHFDFKLVDDPMNPRGSESEIKSSAANTYMDAELSTRNTDPNVTVQIVVMQRLSLADTTQHLLDKAKSNPDVRPIEHICLPITYQEYIKPPELKRFYIANGGYLDPVRRGKRSIATQRANLGPYSASGQLDQIPISKGEGLFNVDRIQKNLSIPMLNMIDESVRYWDKAGTEGGGDFSCGTLMHRMKKEYFGPRYVIQDMERGQWSSVKRNIRIKEIAKRDMSKFPAVINWIEQEPGSGGKESAEITVKELAGFRVKTETKQSAGGKIGRAEPFADQVEAGNVGFCTGIWNVAAEEEMAVAPRGKYDDTWDSAAGAFNKLAIGLAEAGTW
jgi:predicted phage terminase large subunit-like protein